MYRRRSPAQEVAFDDVLDREDPPADPRSIPAAFQPNPTLSSKHRARRPPSQIVGTMNAKCD